MKNNINKTSSDFSPDNFVPFAVTEEEKAWLSEYREKYNAVFSNGKPVTEEGLETIKELTSQNTYVFLYAKYKKAQKTIKIKASVAAFFALFATLIGTSIIEVIFPVRGFIYACLSCSAIVSATSSAYASVKRKMYDKIFSQVPKQEELTNTPNAQSEEVQPPAAEQSLLNNAAQEEDIEESKPSSETPSPALQSVEAEQKCDLLSPSYLHPFAETAMEKENTSNSVQSNQKKIIVSLSIVCAVFLISTVAMSIATYTETQKANDLQATVKELKDENFELQKDIIHKDGEIDDLTSKYNGAMKSSDFLDKHFAFVASKDDDCYHKYSCFKFQYDIRDGGYYQFYFIDDAESNGYLPCQYCH